MSTFDAGLEDLEYDFTKFQPGVKGLIPEPSSDQIETFLAVLSKIMPTKVSLDDQGREKRVLDIDKISETFGEDGPEDAEAIVNAAVSAVCSGTPTAGQIDALPYRVKQRFYGWIVGTFLSPEA